MLQKLKTGYILWHGYHQNLVKTERYSLGQRIDTLFIEAIEAVAIAAFLSREEKTPYVRLGIRKIDTLKILLIILWEIKALDDKKYISLSEHLNEAGKMLGGWFGQLSKTPSAKATWCHSKTLPTKRRERNEESCEHGGGMVCIPIVVEPVVVPVPPPTVPVQIQSMAVVIRATKYMGYHLCHHPSNTLRVEPYVESRFVTTRKITNTIHQYPIPSIFNFLKFLHTPYYPKP